MLSWQQLLNCIIASPYSYVIDIIFRFRFHLSPLIFLRFIIFDIIDFSFSYSIRHYYAIIDDFALILYMPLLIISSLSSILHLHWYFIFIIHLLSFSFISSYSLSLSSFFSLFFLFSLLYSILYYYFRYFHWLFFRYHFHYHYFAFFIIRLFFISFLSLSLMPSISFHYFIDITFFIIFHFILSAIFVSWFIARHITDAHTPSPTPLMIFIDFASSEDYFCHCTFQPLNFTFTIITVIIAQ